jgi:hypothetical protein
MAMMRGSRSARSGWIAGVLVALALAQPPDASASCQEEWCHQRSRLHGREREAELRKTLASAPDDAEAARRLLDELGRKAWRERAIAEYETRYRWEPPPDLTHLEAEIAAEQRRLAERLLRLERDDPRAWCRHAHQLASGDERVELLRRRLEERPDEPRLVVCLAQALVGLERVDQALALLRGYLAEHAEPLVADELIRRLGKDEAEVLAVRESMARRRPDDLESQRRLLAFLTAPDRFPRYEQRARRLTEELLAGAGSLADLRWICWTIDHRGADELRRTCWEFLYSATLAEEESEELGEIRRHALEWLVGSAFRARDWPRLEAVVSRIAAEDLPSTWSRIIDFTDNEYCPQFVAAFDRGIEWAGEWDARRLIATLRECGQEGRARGLAERAGLLREDGSDRTSTPGIDWLRERSCPFSAQTLPRRRWFSDLADDPNGRLRGAYEHWTREEPVNGCAWLGLATLHERAGDAEAALAAWGVVADLQPANLDVVVAFGAAALRLERPAAVRAAADRLRRDPAAVPRHQAEADYLLGRLARREGRWEDASDLLASYFLRRLEFADCPVRACDRALLLHLVEAGDGERLARYLSARKPLVAVRLERHAADSMDPRERILHARLHQSFELDEAALALDCVSPRALARLESRAAAEEDEASKNRLAQLRSRRPCTTEELPDPEPLFPDAELLALSWTLRQID